MTLHLISISELHKAIETIPTLPVVALKALEILEHADMDMEHLNKTISKDPVLAGRILSVANSPFYGLSGKVGGLNEAFIILGMDTICSIVLAAYLINNFSPQNGVNLDYYKLWRHALGTAAAAKIFAEHCGHGSTIASTAGLLHNIGKMLLDTLYPDAYTEVLRYQNKHECSLIKAERSILGLSHCDAGSALISMWHLPDAIAYTLKRYHHPDANNGEPLVDLVHVASITASNLAIGHSGDILIPQLNKRALQRLNLDSCIIQQHYDQIKKLAQESESLVN